MMEMLLDVAETNDRVGLATMEEFVCEEVTRKNEVVERRIANMKAWEKVIGLMA